MSMRIFVMSDPHGDVGKIDLVVNVLKKVDVAIVCGDLSESGEVDSARKVLEKLSPYVRKMLVVHGNWDGEEVKEMLDGRGVNLHSRSILINGVGFFGVGGSTPTPFNTASEYEEDEIVRFLDMGFAGVINIPTKILVSHVPPWKACDLTLWGNHAGSRAVHDFLEKNRVSLCLCGHIHEARGVTFLGYSTVVNPGSFLQGHYFIVEIEHNGRVRVEGVTDGK